MSAWTPSAHDDPMSEHFTSIRIRLARAAAAVAVVASLAVGAVGFGLSSSPGRTQHAGISTSPGRTAPTAVR
jgi:hypothetical protein